MGLHDSAESAASQAELGNLPEWDLTDLYAAISAPEVERDLERTLAAACDFEKTYKSNLATLFSDADADADCIERDAENLLAAVRAYEELEDLLGRLISFAGLVYAGDTTDADRIKFYGDIQEKITASSAHLLFFSLELNQIPDAALQRGLRHDGLAAYRPWLEDIRKEKPFQLEDRIEQLFHEKSVTGRGAWNRLFDETIANLRFSVDGSDLTLEATLTLMQDPQEAKRKAGSQALAKTFRENLRTFALITNTLAKDKEISDRWRGFEDVADSRHLANRVEPEVVGALVDAVRGAYPRLSHRYYALKAQWLGKDKLAHWDRNAPLPDADTRPIPWDEARQTVLSAYSGFSPELASIANDFFDRSWIDAPSRPGKAPGAFSHPTVPSAHPYVLLNYQGKIRDVMTLAHELGHGVHQVLASPQGALMAPTPLTLAETASVFGEMLTFRSLLEKAESVQARKIMLAGKVEDMINTVARQIAFYWFERKVHLERRNGEMTADQICDLWMSVQAESLGPHVELGEGYETFWAYIPHFIHSPFYVYAYAFGDCLVNSLYAVYQNADAGFQEKYFDLLKAGGTKHHSELLAPFGLNAGDPAFWQMGLSVIEGLIDELEAMESA